MVCSSFLALTYSDSLHRATTFLQLSCSGLKTHKKLQSCPVLVLVAQTLQKTDDKSAGGENRKHFMTAHFPVFFFFLLLWFNKHTQIMVQVSFWFLPISQEFIWIQYE